MNAYQVSGTKRFVARSLEELQARVEKECGRNFALLEFSHVRSRGLRSLFWPVRVEATVVVEEKGKASE